MDRQDKLETGAVLLVGEGDFSFSVSLQQKISAAVQITTSTLLSQAVVQQTHKDAAASIKVLKDQGRTRSSRNLGKLSQG